MKYRERRMPSIISLCMSTAQTHGWPSTPHSWPDTAAQDPCCTQVAVHMRSSCMTYMEMPWPADPTTAAPRKKPWMLWGPL